MKRILLIGRDPVFAWALEKTTASFGYHIEHVYTLTEAKLRMSRFEYSLILLDGLSKEESESIIQTKEPDGTVLVLDAALFIPKENAIASVLASIQK
jgi:DNA-binding response OmpR family regulator